MTVSQDPKGNLVEQKKKARMAAAKTRKFAAKEAAAIAPNRIAAYLKETGLAKEGMIVSGFLPIGSEVDTRPVLEELRAMGLIICLPCVEAKDAPLTFRKWHPDDEMIIESFGTTAPAKSAEEVDPDILLSPLLSFDRAGYRLGYGGGFYDRTLQKLRKIKPVMAIGVAYSAQEVDTVPRDELDQPLDMILTEKEMIKP